MDAHENRRSNPQRHGGQPEGARMGHATQHRHEASGAPAEHVRRAGRLSSTKRMSSSVGMDAVSYTHLTLPTNREV